MPLLVALDLGTSKLSALALELDGLVPQAVAALPNDADLTGRPPGVHEQDPIRIRDQAWALLRRLLAETAVAGKEIVGLSLTGQMHGVVVVQGDLRPVGPLITWRDQRLLQASEGDELATRLQEVGASAAPRTGCRLHAGYGGATLAYLHRTAGLPDGVTALSLADYLAATLTDVVATEPTHAASWGLLNLERRQWDTETVARLGLPQSLLPPVRPTSSVLGTLRPQLAATLGLPPGLPVCSPIGDNQASIVGVAGLAGDAAVVNLGTGGQISVPAAQAAQVEGFETRPMPFGGSMLVGASLCGGWTYAYLGQFFQDVLRQVAGVERSREQVYAAMNRLAAAAPSQAAGLVVDPRFSGTRSQPQRRGSLHGIDTDNLTAAHLTRAFLEGMVRELAELFHAAGNPKVTRIVASGNAVRHNPLILEILAELFGRPCQASARVEEAALGAAYAAAIGLGHCTPADLPLPNPSNP